MAMRNSVFASMLMVVGIVVLANLSGISAQFDCGGDLQAVVDHCESFVGKGETQVQPSQECCSVLKNIDVPCFCQKYLTPEFEQRTDLKKVLYVARTCGRSVPAGFQCGKYTVPE